DSLTEVTRPTRIEPCFGPLKSRSGVVPPRLLLQDRDLSQVAFHPLATMCLLDGEPQRAADQRDHEQNRGAEKGRCRRPSPDPFKGPLYHARSPGRDGLAALETFEVCGEIGRAWVTPPRVLRQTLQANRFQIARDFRVQARWRNWVFRDHLKL